MKNVGNNMPTDDAEKHGNIYSAIVSFYDLAEKLVNSVEHPNVKDPVSHLDFVEPIIKQIEESTDILSAEYRNFVTTGKKPGFLARKKIEKAIKAVNNALLECRKHLEN